MGRRRGRLIIITALLAVACITGLDIPGQPEYIHIADVEGCWGRVDTVLTGITWRIDTSVISITDDSLDAVWFVEKTTTAGYPAVIKRAELTLEQGHTFGDTLRPHLDYVEPEYPDRDVELIKIADTLYVSGNRYVKRPCQ